MATQKARPAKPSVRAPRPKRPGTDPVWQLRLYVTGVTPQSTSAIRTIKAICAEYLVGRYDLTVIDVYQQPALAFADGIIAAPALVRIQPPPVDRIVGDLADKDRVLARLKLA